MWIEIAVGGPQKRGTLIREEKLGEYIEKYGKEQPIYRSVYRYPDEILAHIEKEHSTAMYFGVHDISSIPIDIDKGANTPEHTLEIFRAMINQLFDEGMNGDNCQAYFSGTGYHLNIHRECFGFPVGTDLPYIVKGTMEHFSDILDVSIYKRTSLYRCVYTKNQKSGLYKIPLSIEEVFTLTPNEIISLARTQREFEFETKFGDGELAHLVIKEIPEIKQRRTISEPIKIATCIQKMYNQGATDGERNNSVLRMSSHFRRCGIPSSACKAALLRWNNNSLEPNLIEEKVEYVYNSNYKYGCNDFLLKKYCDPKCIYYNRKDYTIDIYNSDDMQKELETWFATDWSGKTIDLAKLLFSKENHNYNRDDLVVYPGELVTIFGPTGCNKTALIQNIILGYNGFEDRLYKEYQIPTLFLSLEISARFLHQRNLQIVSGKTKQELQSNFPVLYRQYKSSLAHVIVQTVSPTIKQIKEKIRELNPLCVVVDYIELIKLPGKSKTEQIAEITQDLRSLAVNLDIIIIQLSQISREYSKNQEQALDLYAGKGSGAIENSSSKVIGIDSQANQTKRDIKLFKNTEGSLFETTLYWTPSWRLKGREL